MWFRDWHLWVSSTSSPPRSGSRKKQKNSSWLFRSSVPISRWLSEYLKAQGPESKSRYAHNSLINYLYRTNSERKSVKTKNTLTRYSRISRDLHWKSIRTNTGKSSSPSRSWNLRLWRARPRSLPHMRTTLKPHLRSSNSHNSIIRNRTKYNSWIKTDRMKPTRWGFRFSLRNFFDDIYK